MRTPVFEAPAFEPSLVPVFDPASVTNAERGSAAGRVVRPGAVPAAAGELERRRPADLSEVAAAWRQVIEERAAPERPADLAGYVGQGPRRGNEAEPVKPARPTDLGSYAAEGRPGGIGAAWQQETWRRPEHLGDEAAKRRPEPAKRRPATLADHVPAQRRGEDEPEESSDVRRP
jgi:hypothetical protein